MFKIMATIIIGLDMMIRMVIVWQVVVFAGDSENDNIAKVIMSVIMILGIALEAVTLWG